MTCPLCQGSHTLSRCPRWKVCGDFWQNRCEKSVFGVWRHPRRLYGGSLRRARMSHSKSGVRYPRTEGSNPSLSANEIKHLRPRL